MPSGPDNKVRKVELLCFDKEDCLEGLYHDQLAEQLAADTKEGVLDEVLDLVDWKAGQVARKGRRVVRKFSDLTRGNRTIFIERGRELLITLPEQEEE